MLITYQLDKRRHYSVQSTKEVEIFGEAMTIALNFHGDAKPKKPTKLSDDRKKN